MNTRIALAHGQQELKKNGLSLRVTREEFSDGDVDTLECTGSNAWQVPVKCVMAGYGMFRANWLLDLGEYIGFVQLYEHSRGGHADPAITIVDLEGAVRGTIYRYAGDFEVAAYSDQKLWLLHRDGRGHREAGLANSSGSCLMQIDLATGTIESETPIQVSAEFFQSQQLAHGWLTSIGLSSLRVAFSEAKEQVVLNISVVNYQRDKTKQYESLQIPLAEFLKTI